jgi:uncharacterized protein YidB (DUF937 family)
VPEVLERIVEILGGDVGDVLADLRSSNLSGRFDSWVRDGDNDRVTADEISDALGKTHLAVIAEQTGLSERQAVERIAEELPGLIDEATPGGDPAALDGLASTTPSAAYLRAYPGGADSGSGGRKSIAEG